MESTRGDGGGGDEPWDHWVGVGGRGGEKLPWNYWFGCGGKREAGNSMRFRANGSVCAVFQLVLVRTWFCLLQLRSRWRTPYVGEAVEDHMERKLRILFFSTGSAV